LSIYTNAGDEPVSDSDRLRDRATQLFAMALRAREQGSVSADEIEKLAQEGMAQAEEMDRRGRTHPPAAEAPQQVGQQQQQPQPKKK
jgi:hypothetical protein